MGNPRKVQPMQRDCTGPRSKAGREWRDDQRLRNAKRSHRVAPHRYRAYPRPYTDSRTYPPVLDAEPQYAKKPNRWGRAKCKNRYKNSLAPRANQNWALVRGHFFSLNGRIRP